VLSFILVLDYYLHYIFFLQSLRLAGSTFSGASFLATYIHTYIYIQTYLCSTIYDLYNLHSHLFVSYTFDLVPFFSQVNMAESSYNIGDRVFVRPAGCNGVVMFTGATEFASGHWLGIMLGSPSKYIIYFVFCLKSSRIVHIYVFVVMTRASAL
jgi:hypothetical protein